MIRQAHNLLQRPSLSSARSPSLSTNSRIRNALRTMSSLSDWSTLGDPTKLGENGTPYAVQNLVDGKWADSSQRMDIIHPFNKDANPIFSIPDTQSSEIQPFLESLRKVPKSGIHNPIKNPHRYVEYGEISRKVSFTGARRMNDGNSPPAVHVTRFGSVSVHGYFLFFCTSLNVSLYLCS